MTGQKVCKDCRAEGRAGKPLNAPFPGPRCYLHDRAWKRRISDNQAAQRWKANFEITADAYKAILAVQGGGCAICGRKPRKGGRRLAVDHDHACCPGRMSCGKCVRMLACWTCNKYLHHIKDDPVTLERAAATLRNPPAKKILQESSLQA